MNRAQTSALGNNTEKWQIAHAHSELIELG